MSKCVYFDRTLFNSKAFKELSGNATKVLMWFYYKRQMRRDGRKGKQKWVIVNNGDITFYYNEAQKKCGISRQTFNRAIDELVKKGFIDIARPGMGLARQPTLYSISRRWHDYGTDEFQEVKRCKIVTHRPKKAKKKD